MFDKILNNIDLTVQKGEKVALIGPNGSGKSTILKIVGKIENINSGEVSIRKGASIGYLSQIPIEINIKVSDYIYNTFIVFSEYSNCSLLGVISKSPILHLIIIVLFVTNSASSLSNPKLIVFIGYNTFPNNTPDLNLE